ncbi:hypothetical protein MMC06_001039 [Schaereria dolodes]|nr:hypothetical protein [Schaereria dolodes]
MSYAVPVTGCCPSPENLDPHTLQLLYKRRQERIANGEDPDAEFVAKVKAREQNTQIAKLKRRLFGKKEKKGYEPSAGESLSKEEEEKEARGGDEDWMGEDRQKNDGVIR